MNPDEKTKQALTRGVEKALPNGTLTGMKIQKATVERHVVDALLLVKVQEGTVHQVIITPEQMNEVFALLKATGGVQIVIDPVPFQWSRPDQ